VQALWGVGKESRVRLEAAGVGTVGDLRVTSPSTLRAILGFAAERLVALSRGEDDRPVEPGGDAKSIGRETTFGQDTRDEHLLARTLRGLSEDVARRMRAEGFTGRVVTLKVRFEPFDTITRRMTLPAATDHGGRIAETADGLWQRVSSRESGRRVRLIGVSVSALERPAASQVGLFAARARGDPAHSSPQDDEVRLQSVDRVVDAINERFGSGTVNSAGALEPEEATRRRPRRPRSPDPPPRAPRS
jgi:DNA polymerase-4